MKETLPVSPCPCCYAALEAATGITDTNALPQPGDVTLCMYCGAKLKFDAVMKMVPLSADQFQKLDPQTRHQLNVSSRLIRTPAFREILKLKPVTV
ncbi:hypothetical protein [Prosthecobacter sp.]|uniref:hypothetical protein n=1 Tax=Prosthecobacter sp. TaxID=1965333 RepID=UPI00378456A6